MRCYVCNSYIEDPEFDQDHKALPCPDCNDVVIDTLFELEAGEGELSDEEDEDDEDEDELP